MSDIYNNGPDWKKNPWIILLLVWLVFPVGLYFVWKYSGWKKEVKWGITGFMAFLIMVAAVTGERKDDKQKLARTDQPQSADGESTEASEANVAPTLKAVSPRDNQSGYKVGEAFQLGDFKYTILSIDRRHQIGSYELGEFIGETAKQGASFIVISYLIENCARESKIVDAEDFKLIDAQGRTFTTSADASTALLMSSDDKDFLISELHPGIPRKMQQGFELPDASLESELTLVVPKKGFFSRGDARLQVTIH